VAKANGNGRHRRRRRHLPLPSVVGSIAVAAAASGALTMPQAGATSIVAAEPLTALPERPAAPTGEIRGALDTVVAASQSLATESTETARAAVAAEVEKARQEAADRAARAEREARSWVAPLQGYRVTAGFGSAGRLWSSRHTGLDLAAPYGAPVAAVSAGEIVFAGYDGAYGNKVVVRHWDGTETWYCHLSRITARSGSVAAGEQVGNLGSSGNSTGPHLHLEVHPGGGDAVNPRSWFAERGLSL
jgi:murein DD-endopeptidase MepM/ murein hydrolase activator NlpD